jgi:hypothetical protein
VLAAEMAVPAPEWQTRGASAIAFLRLNLRKEAEFLLIAGAFRVNLVMQMRSVDAKCADKESQKGRQEAWRGARDPTRSWRWPRTLGELGDRYARRRIGMAVQDVKDHLNGKDF